MQIDALVCRGLQDASGRSAKKQIAQEVGNLLMQAKKLLARGFTFADYLGVEPYWGTLNCYVGQEQVDPERYCEITHADRSLADFDRQIDPGATQWDTKFFDIKWHPDKPSENLFLLKGMIFVGGLDYACCIYFPNPTGGTATYHPSTVVEIIAPPISFGSNTFYGHRVTLVFPDNLLVVKARTQPSSLSPNMQPPRPA